MSDASASAFDQFISPENAWIHEGLATLDAVFGVSDVDVDTDENGTLVVTVTADPVAA